MSSAVRYSSRSGNNKALAGAIANGANTVSISVDAANSPLKSKVDVLFIGGGLYAYGLDKGLKTFLEELDPKLVGKAVLFSSTWLSKHSLDLMKKALTAKGISVEEEFFYVKNKPSTDQLSDAMSFGKKYAK